MNNDQDAYLGAIVPRRLRLNASVQLAGMRIPARAFLMSVGIVAIGGIAITLGADLERVIWWCGGLIMIGLAALEGRIWGRSSRAAALIVWRHVRRTHHLRLAPLQVCIMPEPGAPDLASRRPRWQIGERQHE